MDIRYISSEPLGQIVIEVFDDIVPNTAKLFCERCSAEASEQSYKNSRVRTIVSAPDFGVFIQPHTSPQRKPEFFDDENFNVPHDRPGIVSMLHNEPNANDGQFVIITRKLPWMDGKYVAFGQVIKGVDVVEKIAASSVDGAQRIRVANCGIIEPTAPAQ